MLLTPSPMSQTVTPSRTPSPSSVTYFMDGPKEPKYRTVRSNTGHLATLWAIFNKIFLTSVKWKSIFAPPYIFVAIDAHDLNGRSRNIHRNRLNVVDNPFDRGHRNLTGKKLFPISDVVPSDNGPF